MNKHAGLAQTVERPPCKRDVVDSISATGSNLAEVTMNTIKDMVKDGKKVRFAHFKENALWYETECGFSFPVPVEETGTATFLPEDKAMLFMRYIRKHIAFLEAAKTEQDRIRRVSIWLRCTSKLRTME